MQLVDENSEPIETPQSPIMTQASTAQEGENNVPENPSSRIEISDNDIPSFIKKLKSRF